MLPAWLRGEASRARLASRERPKPAGALGLLHRWGEGISFIRHQLGSLATPGRESHFSPGETEAQKGEVFCPATAQELSLAGTQGPEGPTQPSSSFLPVQFLFLVLRYCDERSFSSHTSYARLGGGWASDRSFPPSPCPPHLRPFRDQGPELQEQAEERHPPTLPMLLSAQLEVL